MKAEKSKLINASTKIYRHYKLVIHSAEIQLAGTQATIYLAIYICEG